MVYKAFHSLRLHYRCLKQLPLLLLLGMINSHILRFKVVRLALWHLELTEVQFGFLLSQESHWLQLRSVGP